VHHEHTGSSVGTGSEWSTFCSNFLEAASKLYSNSTKVPYHTWFHAVDVTFTMFRLLHMCATEHYLGSYERFALVVAAVGHDISHPGLNNLFLCETSHELAIRYNDSSPLENMHCAVLFELVRRPSCAILGDLQQAHYKEVRHLIIEAVLNTDYQYHFNMVKEIQTLYEMNSELFDTSEEAFHTGEAEFPSKEVVDFLRGADVKKQFRLVFLHFSDVAQSMKTFSICESWASLIVEEFFIQGDKEKEVSIPVQSLNDRDKVNKPYSQVAFIEFFVAPLALSLTRLVPTLDLCAECLIDNMWLWFDIWVQETEPTPDQDEQNKLRERISKVERKHQTRGSIQE
jgi:cAMP-specific phosphodiesterase 4